ncbi:MAG: AI-2E family transporter [Deltaproteobacteria bacterium HGW-Deltaproteobacteria-10]|jgi:predicted PurR-regulated permease PerM|nr:MAG: AI-2E family transporter [Deltaproteobacteria bacterium HGW-Deltaproteobacteria-2]PKN63737.1 MAG: AI-2E family transporter [Deltaproteobacteria bacterium HGW-Deltaproteobacteria-10]
MKDKQQTNFQNIIFLILLAFITGLLAYILKPFFFAVFWAVLIASVFAPLYKFINKKIVNPNICAGITMMGIILCLILPVGLLIDLLIMEIIDIYQSFNSYSSNWIGTFSEALKALSKKPIFASLNLDQTFLINKSQEAFKVLTSYVFSHISEFTQNTILVVVQFAVMLYSLFFFLRDGKRLVKTITENIPVDNKHLEHFINQFLTTAKASLKFTFIIGGIQGFLGGMIFYITGIERALVWGVLMFALSIVPAIGCALIWAPAGIIMLLLGNIWQGVTILIFGSLVISSVDNLLRPVLLGRDTQMHSLLIFLSTLGGIAAMGFSGFILGPVIASLFLAGWKLFPEIYQK